MSKSKLLTNLFKAKLITLFAKAVIIRATLKLNHFLFQGIVFYYVLLAYYLPMLLCHSHINRINEAYNFQP